MTVPSLLLLLVPPASCDTVQVTGGYGYTPGSYTEEGTRNGEDLYVSEDRSSELFFTEREDDDDRRTRTRRTARRNLLLADVEGKGKV